MLLTSVQRNRGIQTETKHLPRSLLVPLVRGRQVPLVVSQVALFCAVSRLYSPNPRIFISAVTRCWLNRNIPCLRILSVCGKLQRRGGRRTGNLQNTIATVKFSETSRLEFPTLASMSGLTTQPRPTQTARLVFQLQSCRSLPQLLTFPLPG